MRRAHGLEAAVVDHRIQSVAALDPADARALDVKVAGPAALLVAKVHKVEERLEDPDRLRDKDAHDMYRLLVTIGTDELVDGFRRLLEDELSAEVTNQALAHALEQVNAATRRRGPCGGAAPGDVPGSPAGG